MFTNKIIYRLIRDPEVTIRRSLGAAGAPEGTARWGHMIAESRAFGGGGDNGIYQKAGVLKGAEMMHNSRTPSFPERVVFVVTR